MLLTITGNEKSGKSTLARRIDESRPSGLHVMHMHFRWWEGFSVSVYAKALELATRPDVLVVLDRCWADDPVYDRLTGRKARYTSEELEWCFGIPASSFGALFVLPNSLAPRDETDYGHTSTEEAAEWRRFAEHRPWWNVREAPPEPEDAVRAARSAYTYRSGLPPTYSGAQAPRIVLVGEERNANSTDPMAWAPLSTRTTRQLANLVPVDAWPYLGLTNAVDLVADRYLRSQVEGAELVVALGGKATSLLSDNDVRVDLSVPHPSAVFRFGKYRDYVNEVYLPMVEAMMRVVEGPTAEVNGGGKPALTY